jgi:hypothetical protein
MVEGGYSCICNGRWFPTGVSHPTELHRVGHLRYQFRSILRWLHIVICTRPHGKMTYCHERRGQTDVLGSAMATEPGRRTYFHVAWVQVYRAPSRGSSPLPIQEHSTMASHSNMYQAPSRGPWSSVGWDTPVGNHRRRMIIN